MTIGDAYATRLPFELDDGPPSAACFTGDMRETLEALDATDGAAGLSARRR